MSQTEKLSFRKQGHPRDSEGGQGWEETDTSDTLNIYDNTEMRTPIVIVQELIHDKDSRESSE